MNTPLRLWGIAFTAMLAAAFVAFTWIDRPLSVFAHDHATYRAIFDALQAAPDAFPAVSAAVLALCAINVLIGRRATRVEVVVLMASVSYVTARAVNTQLKLVFSRTWPETWFGNPSLIGDGSFGFNFFHGGDAYASFPSGHALAICAVVSVLWQCWPRLRPLFALAVAAVVCGLIGANYHFLSDIIVGGFLGCLGGWVTVRLWPKPIAGNSAA